MGYALRMEEAMLPIHIILHPTDFSEQSENALRLAGALARDHGARLVLLHVAPPPTAVYGGAMLVLPPPDPHDEEKDRLAALRRAARLSPEPAPADGGPATQTFHH